HSCEHEQFRSRRRRNVAVVAFYRGLLDWSRLIIQHDVEHRRGTALLSSEIENARTHPGKRTDPAVKVFSETCRFSRLPVVEHQPPAVALVSRALLRTVGDVLAIRRIERSVVGGLVLGGDVLRRRKNIFRSHTRRKIHRDGKQIVVGRSRGHRVMIRGITKLLPIRRKRIIILPAERKDRRVVVAGGEVASNTSEVNTPTLSQRRGQGWGTLVSVADHIRRNHEQMRPLSLLVRIPVSIQQVSENERFDLRLFRLLNLFRIALRFSLSRPLALRIYI